MLSRRLTQLIFKNTPKYSRNFSSSSEKVNHDEFHTAKMAEEQKAKERRESEDRDEELRDKIMDASLPFVPDLGWSDTAVRAGTESLGYPPITSGIIQNPPIDLIHHHYLSSNLKLEELMMTQREELQKSGNPVKIPHFIRNNVETRLRMNIPYMGRWAEAWAVMSHPANNPPQSFEYGLELMDSIWHYAGDKSTDINWYTKRVSLGLIYKSTELAMIQDKSEDYKETWKFLERRLSDHKDFSSIVNDVNDIPQTLSGMAITLKNILGLNK